MNQNLLILLVVKYIATIVRALSGCWRWCDMLVLVIFELNVAPDFREEKW